MPGASGINPPPFEKFPLLLKLALFENAELLELLELLEELAPLNDPEIFTAALESWRLRRPLQLLAATAAASASELPLFIMTFLLMLIFLLILNVLGTIDIVRDGYGLVYGDVLGIIYVVCDVHVFAYCDGLINIDIVVDRNRLVNIDVGGDGGGLIYVDVVFDRARPVAGRKSAPCLQFGPTWSNCYAARFTAICADTAHTACLSRQRNNNHDTRSCEGSGYKKART